MSIPSTATQLLIMLLFVVPGFVYQGVRVNLRGRLATDVDLSTRLVGAIVRSAIFGLVYLAIGGKLLVEAANGKGWLIDHVRVAALIALVGGFVLPALLGLVTAPDNAALVKWLREREVSQWFSNLFSYDHTPTAWDKAFQDRTPCFVRILTSEKEWIAGYYGLNSYSTSFPEKHQVFLEACYEVSKTGQIGDPIPGSEGVIVSCESAISIELIALEESDQRTLEQVEEGAPDG
ncbi:DUF6338 family protein [Kribbella sindirgiensis]|uniref:Uncharacterized protein n=1 Tax=Kribbella sindirgiensis TaxID=1124744 RepID=A0A4R0IMW3_9ACTN|nr:DUF6338 family protein [Kribbella sindirgiensis]TCC34961.1 hypothetical protein E0H50_13810 [Kribbella sindirgiensis]